ncbi:MAG: PAS domain S-box protein, partial [Anaerolineae bacterium]
MGLWNRISEVWRRLTEPLPSVVDPEERLQARWLASLLVIALPLAVIFAAMPSLILRDSTLLEDGDFQVVVASLVLWAAVYWLSRTGRHQLAAGLTITVTSAVLLAIALLDFDIFELNYLLMPILFGSLILPWQVMLVYIAVNLAGLIVLSGFMPNLPLTRLLLEPVSFLGIGSALALVLAHQRTRLADHRRARLAESEARYRTLFESSADAIALVGLDGTVIDCNPAGAEIAQRPREELVGRPFSELGVVPADDLPQHTEILSRAGLGASPDYLEVEAIRSDGSRRWLEAFTTPLERQGEIHAIQVIAHDITDRKQAEEALRHSEERFR